MTTLLASCVWLSAATVAGCGGTGPVSAAPATGGVPADHRLVWSDEFDAEGLPDPAKWGYDTFRNREGWFNNELQYYAAGRRENARVENGSLLITARRERLASAADFGGQNYTSARLLTRGLAAWTYGFFEVRAKLPCAMGAWPAIWMLGSKGTWPDDGEIDIMEQTGWQPGRILGTAHMRDFNGANGRGSRVDITDTCNTFHRYQVLWTRDAITWGVDDVSYFTYARPAGAGYGSWPFDHPQYLLLNLAVGGILGGTPNDAAFPVRMEVDYVRVYQAEPRR